MSKQLTHDEILRIFCIGAEKSLDCNTCQEVFEGIECETTRDDNEVYGPCRACIYAYIKEKGIW